MIAHQRQAPAFQLEVRAPFLWRGATALLWALALLAACAAIAAQLGQRLGTGASLVCWALLIPGLPGLMWWGWRSAAGRVWQLVWDGQQWALRPGEALRAARHDAPRQAVDVQVTLDFGGLLLLRCRFTDAARPSAVYLPLMERDHASTWLPLRWALFSARQLPPEAR